MCKSSVTIAMGFISPMCYHGLYSPSVAMDTGVRMSQLLPWIQGLLCEDSYQGYLGLCFVTMVTGVGVNKLLPW